MVDNELPEDDGELILADLNDEDLTAQMHDDLYDGLADEIAEGTNILLSRGWGADRVLNEALVDGMRIVGIDFRDGILFVPEVLLAANAMKAGMAILRPLLAETGAEPIGKVVIGTVKGDIHDIGKNLVAMMLEGAGFEVVDLGINTDVDEYLAALEEHKPDILGMSALLTTTMPYMKVVIDTLTEKGLRDDYIILVGGAPLNEEFGQAIGADAYCRERGRRGRDCNLIRRGAPGYRRVMTATPRTLVLGCGALVNELLALCRLNALDSVKVECLPASLHMEPAKIPGELRTRLDRAAGEYDHILVGYADCGTAGQIDAICDDYGVTRLPGAHCYEFFATSERFTALHDADPTIFYLTDYLTRHFELFVLDGLGITAHPELLPMYFGNYTRLCYLAQTHDPDLDRRAEAAAVRLGLNYERIFTGYGELGDTFVELRSRTGGTLASVAR